MKFEISFKLSRVRRSTWKEDVSFWVWSEWSDALLPQKVGELFWRVVSQMDTFSLTREDIFRYRVLDVYKNSFNSERKYWSKK